MAKKSASREKKPKPKSTRVSDKSKTNKSEAKTYKRLPSALVISKKALDITWKHKRLFLSIILIYGLLNLLLVQGLASASDINSLKSQITGGHLNSVISSFSIFVVLIGSAGNGSSQTAGAYQFFLGVMVSLALIWALRQVYISKYLRIRDSFYLGMSPLIPFIFILLLIFIELLPMLVGASLYNTVLTNGIAIGALEKIVWLIIFLGLTCLSVFFISSSIFSLYIVTLPDMTPVKALKSAKELVKGRRLPIVRKLLFLPLMLLIIAAIVMLPIIIWVTGLASWVFFILTCFALLAIHSYLYNLYRELLQIND